MNRSGCKNCPVKPCETLYRGSICLSRRHKLGLGDPMTNADRIRAMSDEDLAGFLMKLMHNNVQCFGEGMFPYHPCPQEQNCKQCGLDWLQQPSREEGKHEPN